MVMMSVTVRVNPIAMRMSSSDCLRYFVMHVAYA